MTFEYAYIYTHPFCVLLLLTHTDPLTRLPAWLVHWSSSSTSRLFTACTGLEQHLCITLLVLTLMILLTTNSTTLSVMSCFSLWLQLCKLLQNLCLYKNTHHTICFGKHLTHCSDTIPVCVSRRRLDTEANDQLRHRKKQLDKNTPEQLPKSVLQEGRWQMQFFCSFECTFPWFRIPLKISPIQHCLMDEFTYKWRNSWQCFAGTLIVFLP